MLGTIVITAIGGTTGITIFGTIISTVFLNDPNALAVLKEAEVFEFDEFTAQCKNTTLEGFIDYLVCDGKNMLTSINNFQTSVAATELTASQTNALSNLQQAEDDLLKYTKEAQALSGSTDQTKYNLIQDKFEDAEERASAAVAEFKGFSKGFRLA